jgi:hypothetical protein
MPCSAQIAHHLSRKQLTSYLPQHQGTRVNGVHQAGGAQACSGCAPGEQRIAAAIQLRSSGQVSSCVVQTLLVSSDSWAARSVIDPVAVAEWCAN